MKKRYIFFLPMFCAASAVAQTQIDPGRIAWPLNQSTSITAKSINSVLYADQFPGADIGAQINAAFASCTGTRQSCYVKLRPGGYYVYTTPIVVPGGLVAFFPDLDLSGATLYFNGSGDAVTVAAENASYQSGSIHDGYIFSGSAPGVLNTSSVNGIHQNSRVGFVYRDLTILGFNNAGGADLFLDNTKFPDGTTGYNERTQIIGVTFSGIKGLRFLGSDGGTNSFARTNMVHSFCNANTNQYCISVEGNGTAGSTDVYDSTLEMFGNFSGSGGRTISITNGGDVRNGTVRIGVEGPNTNYGVYLDGLNLSSFTGETGKISLNGPLNYNAGVSSLFSAPDLSYGNTLQPAEGSLGVAQARNSKRIWDGFGAWRFGMASLGGVENNGYFQLFSRNTNNPSDPEVDCTSGCAHAQVNTFLATPMNGVGIGPGFGFNVNTGGTNLPRAALDTTQLIVGTTGTVVNGLQVASVAGCAITAGAIGNFCTATVTLSPVQPDTNYSIVGCNVYGAAVAGAHTGNTASKTTTTFQVNEFADATTSTGGGTISCLIVR